MSEWQPIETAPKDGTWVLATMAGLSREAGLPYVPTVVRWYEGGWQEDEFEEVFSAKRWPLAFWMPLPPPPEATNV